MIDSKPVGRTPSRGVYRRLATSRSPAIVALKRIYRGFGQISLPAPRVIIMPMLWAYVAVRSCWHFFLRVFIAEPLFKAYCTRYGKGLRTDIYVHWVQGKGDFIVGDNVRIGGKCHFRFGARFVDRPVLEIGDNSGIGSGCHITVGKRITIGRNVVFSGNTHVFDSSGHPSDPLARIERQAPDPDDVRPIKIGDYAWIGQRCIIFPGVRIGEHSVISAGSVVRTHIPPYSVAAGNPAKVMFRLKRPDETLVRAIESHDRIADGTPGG